MAVGLAISTTGKGLCEIMDQVQEVVLSMSCKASKLPQAHRSDAGGEVHPGGRGCSNKPLS